MLLHRVVAVVTLTATFAGGDVLPLAGPGEPGLSMLASYLESGPPQDTSPGRFDPLVLRERLTFLTQERDSNKDGFVDSGKVADANPTGYVVFHFLSLWHNERITLGGDGPGLLLSVEMGRSGGGARIPDEDPLPRAATEPYPPGQDPDPFPSGRPVPIPEPGALLLLSGGAVVVALRRRRRLAG